MDNQDLDLFDKKIKSEIKNSFDDIKFTSILEEKIKDKMNKDKSFKGKIKDFLNYEIEVPIGRIGVIAALLALIPTTFSIYEGNKIMKNSIKYESSSIVNNDVNK